MGEMEIRLADAIKLIEAEIVALTSRRIDLIKKMEGFKVASAHIQYKRLISEFQSFVIQPFCEDEIFKIDAALKTLERFRGRLPQLCSHCGGSGDGSPGRCIHCGASGLALSPEQLAAETPADVFFRVTGLDRSQCQ